MVHQVSQLDAPVRDAPALVPRQGQPVLRSQGARGVQMQESVRSIQDSVFRVSSTTNRVTPSSARMFSVTPTSTSMSATSSTSSSTPRVGPCVRSGLPELWSMLPTKFHLYDPQISAVQLDLRVSRVAGPHPAHRVCQEVARVYQVRPQFRGCLSEISSQPQRTESLSLWVSSRILIMTTFVAIFA